jgi:hypothetical protein
MNIIFVIFIALDVILLVLNILSVGQIAKADDENESKISRITAQITLQLLLVLAIETLLCIIL